MLGLAKQVDVRNSILAALPWSEFARISDHIETVRFETGEIVYAAGDIIRHAYFPVDGLLALVSTTVTGDSVELAMVGTEGMVGFSVMSKMGVSPYEVVVRTATEALKINAAVLRKEFDRGEQLHDLMVGYVSTLMVEISQLSTCHRFHSIEEALSRWLLAVQDRVNSDTLNLTQELISNALGVPRTSVTVAAGSLQRAGVIRYSRGKIV